MIVHGSSGTSKRPERDRSQAPQLKADACFEAMLRHCSATRRKTGRTSLAENPRGAAPAAAGSGSPPGGGDDYNPSEDILYGGRAIARWLYADDSDRARRKVFYLASLNRPGMGFFRMGATICLSKSQFLAYVRGGGKLR